MGRSAVRVFVRTRPIRESSDAFVFDVEKQTVNVRSYAAKQDENSSGRNSKRGTVNNNIGSRTFRFDHILRDVSQETVFDTCCAGIIESVLEGYNGTLMAYGQTGAGKTFTVSGGTANYKFRGLMPRAITYAFNLIDSRPELAVTVRISYLEIYNETLFDLLAEQGSATSALAIMEAREGGVMVNGLRKVIANNEEEALILMFTGDTNRAIGAHSMNAQSSRSHCIFTIYLESRSRVESAEKVVSAKLHLVDLAGSERVKKTNSSGIILKEAGYINKSLTFLEQVVIALSSKNRDHVPFRSSKLTNVLRDSLGGNCKTHMVANIWPEARYIEETVSTLKFATRMMCVSCEPIVNVQLDPVLQVKKLQRRICELKQELAMHDALAGRAPQVYDDYTEDQKSALSVVVDKYIRGEVDDMEISSLRQVREVFQLFRTHAQNLEQSFIQASRAASEKSSTSDGEKSSTSQDKAGSETEASKQDSDKLPDIDTSRQSAGDEEEEFVGELDESTVGFGVGTVPASSRPEQMALVGELPHQSPAKSVSGGDTLISPLRHLSPRHGGGAGAMDALTSARSIGRNTMRALEAGVPTEEEAFEEYKTGAGTNVNEQLVENRAQLQIKRRDLKTLSAAVNESKREIDRLKNDIQARRDAAAESEAASTKDKEDKRGDETPVTDEEEFALIGELKSQKEKYQEHYHKRKMVQAEVLYLKGVVDRGKVALCSSFLEWFAAEYGVTSKDGPANGDNIPPKGGAGIAPAKSEEADDVYADPEAASFYNARNAVARIAKIKKRSMAATGVGRPSRGR